MASFESDRPIPPGRSRLAAGLLGGRPSRLHPRPQPHVSPRPQVSVVVPVFNEEESLPRLHAELAASLSRLEGSWEVIYVDDGSRDKSLAVLLGLWRSDRHVRVVKFPRNYGQTSALSAGFDVSRGSVVVTMDGDLQNDPADIPRLVAKVGEGFDIVAGWRKRRQDGFVLRRLPSRMANWLIAMVTGVTIHDTGCTLKAFRRELVKNLPIYAEQHRFLPVMSAGSGARVAELVVNHRPRVYGHSKYGLSRALRVLLDLLSIKLIAQFSQRPLHYFGLLSLTFLGLAMFFALAGLVGLTGFLDLVQEPMSLASTSSTGLFGGRWQLTITAICTLLVMLIVYFGLLGLLGELAVKASGMHRRRILDRILNELH